MSSTSDTPEIDEKNQSTSSTTDFYNGIKNFFTSLLSFIILIIIYVFIGGFILYGCKVGQSNIMPTDMDCMPYSDNDPIIEQVNINIFETLFTDPQLSQKIQFPYDNSNSKNMILDILRKYKEKPSSGSLANYFISIFENLISFNYSAFNLFFNLLNQLPEILIMMFGPLLAIIYSSIILLLDNVYVLVLWFTQMSWFFKKNTNNTQTGKPSWETVTLLEPIDYWIAILYVFLFFILFFVMMFLGFPLFLSSIAITWCFYSIFGYKGLLNGSPIGVLGIIKNIFINYKIVITTILSLFVIISAFANLGTASGIFSILVVLLIYFGIISIEIYKTTKESGLSPVVSSDQANKKCQVKKIIDHGFFYDLIFPQKAGAKLVSEIKKIGKKLQTQ